MRGSYLNEDSKKLTDTEEITREFFQLVFSKLDWDIIQELTTCIKNHKLKVNQDEKGTVLVNNPENIDIVDFSAESFESVFKQMSNNSKVKVLDAMRRAEAFIKLANEKKGEVLELLKKEKFKSFNNIEADVLENKDIVIDIGKIQLVRDKDIHIDISKI